MTQQPNGRHDAIEVMSHEDRQFPPPPAFAEQANFSDPDVYERARQDPEAFWAEQAEHLTWFKKWDRVLDWDDAPFAKWFVGGKLNIAYNCLDRHIEAGKGDKVAYYWEGEPGDKRTITYSELKDEVCKASNALKELDVVKGDRVVIYMPMIPELVVTLLACARIGALHTVVFGGFSADAVRDRINDSEAEIVITSDGGYRRGAPSALKPQVDEAIEGAPSDREGAGRQAHGPGHRHEGGAGLLVERYRRPPVDRARAGVDGQRGHAVPALHLRHDRQAEGHRAHHRRLPHRRGLHASRRLRHQGGRCLLVRRRYRLGDRAQLHRLRPADQRRHERDVRGRADLSGARPLVGHHRALQGDDPLLCPDRDPRAHEGGAPARRRITTSRRCGCSARSASRSTRRRGSGTTSTSAASAARWSIRGGRRRPARS